MRRQSSITVLLGSAVLVATLLVGTLPAGASPVLTVSPNHRLLNNQKLTVKGSGLPRSKTGSDITWFISECAPAAAKVSNLDPDFSPYCSANLVKPLRVTPQGTFSVTLRVATGTIGKGSCGLPGHLTCLIGIGTAVGRHATTKITFKNVFPVAPKPHTKASKKKS